MSHFFQYKYIAAVFVVLFFSIASIQIHVVAATPQTISYQGTLRNAVGAPVMGQYDFIVRYYTAQFGGSSVYQEQFSSTTVLSGSFFLSFGAGSVQSGSFGALDFNQPIFITFETKDVTSSVFDGEMVPRIPFQSVPYARNSGLLQGKTVGGASGVVGYDALGGISTINLSASGLIFSGATNLPITLATGYLNPNALNYADNSMQVLSNGVAVTIDATRGLETTATGVGLTTTCTTGQILQWSGTAWNCALVTDSQTLSIVANTLSISNGNSITLPADADGVIGNEVFDLSAGAGIGLTGTKSTGYAVINQGVLSATTNNGITNSGTTQDPVFGLLATGVIAGTYNNVTVDNFGRVITGANTVLSTTNSLTFSSVTNSLTSIVNGTSSTASLASLASPISVRNTSSLFATGLPSPAGIGATNAANSIFLGNNSGNAAFNAANSNFFGLNAGQSATNAANSNFFGRNAGLNATGAQRSNFFGNAAGNGATSASSSNFFGTNAGSFASYASDANFFGSDAGSGASNARLSNFFGSGAGNGAVDATRSNFFGSNAGTSAINADNSNFFGNNAGIAATNAAYSNFFGTSAGDGATNAAYSNFFGLGTGVNALNAQSSNFYGRNTGGGATNADNSNFFGSGTGQGSINAFESNFFGRDTGISADNANNSNFFGRSAGSSATNANFSNFFGDSAGNGAVNAFNSNFYGIGAGSGAINANNSIFLGLGAGQNDTVNNLTSGFSSILIGDLTGTGGFSNSIALGAGAINTNTNQLYIRDQITNFNLAGVNYVLPAIQGVANSILTNNGTGSLTWTLPTAGATNLKYYSESTTIPTTPNSQPGINSVAIGSGNMVNGTGSFVLGNANSGTSNSAGNTFVGSQNSNASGSETTTVGSDNSISSAYKSMLVGYTNTVINTGLSTIVGYNNIVSTNNALTLGNNLNNSLSNSVQIGTSDTNKLTLFQNGTFDIQGALSIAGNSGTAGQTLMSLGSGASPIWANPAPNQNFANTDLTATGDRVHDFANNNLSILNIGSNILSAQNNTIHSVDTLALTTTRIGMISLSTGDLNMVASGYTHLQSFNNISLNTINGIVNLAAENASPSQGSLFIQSGGPFSQYFLTATTAAGNTLQLLTAQDAPEGRYLGNLGSLYFQTDTNAGQGNLYIKARNNSSPNGWDRLVTNANLPITAQNGSTLYSSGIDFVPTTNADHSVFLGYAAGHNADNSNYSNFIGAYAGYGNQFNSGTATQAVNANFFGSFAGYGAANANNSIFIGNSTGFDDSVNNVGTGIFAPASILIGNFASTGGFSNSIVLGNQGVNTASNQLLIPSSYNKLTIGGVDYVVPNSLGAPGSVLTTDASGTLSWTDVSAGPITVQNTGNLVSSGIGAGVGAVATNAIMLGSSAGYSAGDATSAILIGAGAGANTVNINSSTFVGTNSGTSAMGAYNSSFYGLASGTNATRAHQSSFFGAFAGADAANAANSIFIGNQAGLSDTVNNYFSGTSILIGDSTNTGGFSNSIALGANAINTATNQFKIAPSYTGLSLGGVDYIVPSSQGTAGQVLTNDGSGVLSWTTPTSGAGCIPTGSGIYNTCLGQSALQINNTGANNTAIGAFSLTNNTTGYNNVAVGDFAMQLMQTGNSNVALGSSSLKAYSSSNATAIGTSALESNTTGYANTALGAFAGLGITSGGFNTAIGAAALQINSVGQYNTALGIRAGYFTTGSYNISIGADSDVPVVANSNQLSIGNIIFGTSIGGTVASPTGNIGIGEVAPSTRLQITSDTANTSGLRLTNLTSASPTGLGQAIGVDATGNIITVVAGSSPITAQNGSTLLSSGISFVPTTNADHSIFLGYAAGHNADNSNYSNFIGAYAGYGNQFNNGTATAATKSNFFGSLAGYGAAKANNSIFIGDTAGYDDTVFNSGSGIGSTSSILIGNNTNTGGFSDSIVLGSGGINTASNQFLVPSTYTQLSLRGINYTIPGNQGSVGSVLTNDGSGLLSWQLNSVSPITYESNGSLLSSNMINPAGVNSANAFNSIFLGSNAGSNATNSSYSNFLGYRAGYNATNASDSTFIGIQAGNNAANAKNSIFIGNYAGLNDILNTQSGGSGILIGNSASTGGYQDSVAIGNSATNTATNQFAVSDAITRLRIGGLNYIVPLVQGSAGQTLTNNGSGVLSWTNSSGTTLTASAIAANSGYINGGNTFGANASIGLADNFDLALKTNNADRLSITAAGDISIGGKLSIGTTTPSARLEVNSGIADTSGLKFTSLTSASPAATGQALGVDSTGNVVRIASAAGTLNNAYNFGGAGVGNLINLTTGAGISYLGVQNNYQPQFTVGNGSEQLTFTSHDGDLASRMQVSGRGDTSLTIQGGATASLTFSGGASAGDGSINASNRLDVYSSNTRFNSTNFGIYNGSTPKFTVNSSGSVSIGAFPPTLKLSVTDNTTTNVAIFNGLGSTQCTVITGTGLSCSSDMRLKKNIASLDPALSLINQLRPVTYQWKEGMLDTQSGFIAQEVEAVIPGLVSTNSDGFKSLNTTGIMPYVVKALQEQSAQITAINARLDALVLPQSSAVIAVGPSLTDAQKTMLESFEVTPAALVLTKNLIVKGEIIAQNINTANLQTKGIISVSNRTAGTVEIVPDITEFEVVFVTPYDTQPIVLLTVQENAELKAVVSKSTVTGFTIKLDKPQVTKTLINWFSVQTK